MTTAISSVPEVGAAEGPEPVLLDCPVCPRTGLGPEALNCPNCSVDLRPLWTLRELPRRYREEGAAAQAQGKLDLALERLTTARVLLGDDPALRVQLGRLRWQRGERSAAEQEWREVLAAHPDHGECRALLQGASRSRWQRRLASGAALLAAGIAAIGAATWLSFQGPRSASAFSSTATPPSPFSATANPPGGDSAGALQLVPPLGRIAERLAAQPDLRLAGRGRELRIHFAESLFRSGSDEPHAEGQNSLRGVARVLDAAGVPLVVHVAGLPDARPLSPGSPWTDSAELERARALGAIRTMLSELGPSGNAALRPSGPLEPDPSDAESARNASVVLRIAAR